MYLTEIKDEYGRLFFGLYKDGKYYHGYVHLNSLYIQDIANPCRMEEINFGTAYEKSLYSTIIAPPELLLWNET